MNLVSYCLILSFQRHVAAPFPNCVPQSLRPLGLFPRRSCCWAGEYSDPVVKSHLGWIWLWHTGAQWFTIYQLLLLNIIGGTFHFLKPFWFDCIEESGRQKWPTCSAQPRRTFHTDAQTDRQTPTRTHKRTHKCLQPHIYVPFLTNL